MYFVSIYLLVSCFTKTLGQAAWWRPLPGQYKDLSAKGDSLWAITEIDQVVQWIGNEWVPINGEATRVAATNEGGVFLLNGPNISYSGPNSNVWADMPASGSGVNYINAFSSDPVKLVGIGRVDNGTIVSKDGFSNSTGNGCLQQWNESQQALVARDVNDCKNYKVAVGENEELYKIDLNGTLYHWQDNEWNRTDFIQYQPVQMIPVDVDVQSKDRVVVLGNDGKARRFNGASWDPVTDYAGYNPYLVRVTINKNAVFGLDEHGTIFKIDV